MTGILYAAYGSNIPTQRLLARCADARFMGTGNLSGYRLVFRPTADVEPCIGRTVPVAFWQLTLQDEVRLDRFEGVPQVYRKEYLLASLAGESVKCLVYRKNDGALSAPTADYLQFLQQGYAERSFDMTILELALAESARVIS